ncbi:hypothetical protein F7725_017570 [Dissostichus mawsoni]|uniref:HECT-type E3 ubiquitin transferase n=1 Tax=Dissostichus mawsoni TaxID=36200 RepID=A0A7J5Z800_DISMA|nr:hypothetical protein F7725_017570 [Dissostichus mawsoni]
MEYRSSKSKEKQSFNCGKVRLKQERRQVQINIGMMSPQGVDLKPRRGKTLPLFTDPEIAAPVLLERAVQKMRAFNKDMDEGPYILLYPDCSEVVNVPGSEKPFTLAEYKKDLGKAYARITLFICLEKHFRGGDDTSDSDSEIVITSRSTAKFNQADTVIVISDTEDMGPPKTNTNKTTCYSTYTDLYAPCVEEEDEELVAVHMTEEMNVTLPAIIANLSQPIDHGRVSRFNISRANVWDGAVRGFKRTSYSENCDMLVKFTDDAGVFEEGIDSGGPRRELLSLLRKNLKDRPIFDGPDGHRFLVYNANAVREDEYYLAGKMIAVSVVHGGPGPHFLSEDLVRYLAGQPSFKATVNLITDEEVGKALEEIENAASVDALREMTMRHSTMLQTAGCLRHVASVEEKKGIVSDYLQWYIIGRNSSVIDSPPGSNRRLGESQTLGYWADYLLDCEESQTAVSLEDVLMFATGLTSLPPSGFEPSPGIEFLDDSPFPMANTCSNTLKLPLLESYNVFKSKMDFGMQNSPGFGCY